MNLSMIANTNVMISKQGGYKMSDKGKEVIRIPTKNTSDYWNKETLTTIPQATPNNVYAKIFVYNESVISRIFDIRTLGVNAHELGVLNFASARHPGGGFLSGAMAQEECLCYCSDLYTQILDNEYYRANALEKSALYTDAMIMSSVVFYRDAAFNLIRDPWNSVRVLTCPAVNYGAFVRNLADAPVALFTMKNRMRKVLNCFIWYGCKHLVLGAFGCGVFGNNPATIAEFWSDLLYTEGYAKYFDTIYFSVFDSGSEMPNYTAFVQQFKNN